MRVRPSCVAPTGTHCNYSSALDNGTEGYSSAASAPPDSAETVAEIVVEAADDGFVELGASGASGAGPSGSSQ